jgi:hypothetical protein
MIERWLKPLEVDRIITSQNNENRVLGEVKFTTEGIAAGRTIAILGVDEKWADAVRKHLYQFAPDFAQTVICDLGNFRKPNPEFIAPAITELIKAGVLPVLIGCQAEMGAAMLMSLRSKDPETQGVYVQESFPEWHHGDNIQEQTSFIGIQQHLVSNETLLHLNASNVSWTRLSNVRDAMDESEPEIRDAGFLFFDMSAIRYSDFPAQNSASTSGFFTEEACKIMRYSGTSPRLNCICLSGHDPNSTAIGQSANTQAQLLWYLISGFDQRVIERPEEGDHFTQYVVHLQRYDFDLVFFKSNHSGRWWFKLPSEKPAKLFSCAYGDYLAACEDVVSDRISRFVEMSLDMLEK